MTKPIIEEEEEEVEEDSDSSFDDSVRALQTCSKGKHNKRRLGDIRALFLMLTYMLDDQKTYSTT